MAALLVMGAAPAGGNGRVFDAVWAAVRRDYWDPRFHGLDWDAARARYAPLAAAAPDSEALYAVLNRMLAGLHDSHVFATPPSEVRYEAARDAGDAQASYGFDAYQGRGGWLVYRVMPGGSAARAGVRPGWTLVSIDGRPVDVDRHPAAGQHGRVMLTDIEGRTRVADLVAAVSAPDPTVRASRPAGDVLLIGLDGFDGQEDRRVAAALRDGPAPRAVILDLRENDGGEEQTAARLAGLFFVDRHLLLRRIGRRREEAVPIVPAGDRAYRGPMAVLVGPRSASAAEAVAALFAETGRAATVGETTAGALTGASLDRLPDGGQLSIADSDVRTPGGRRIEGVGFTPAHIVRTAPADMAEGRDPVLAAALRLLSADSLSAPEPLHARP